MNAIAQALSIDAASKIASISTIIQKQFPTAQVDLSPWMLDEQAQSLFDPDSIDVSFSFPTWQAHLGCGCVLLQIYFFGELHSPQYALNRMKMSGHDYRGQHWRFSTYADCQFVGSYVPSPEGKHQLKLMASKLHKLFGCPTPLPLRDRRADHKNKN